MGASFRISDLSGGLSLRSPFRLPRGAANVPVIAISRSDRVTRLALRDGSQIVGGGALCDVVALGISPEQAFSIEVFVDGKVTRARMEALRKGVTFANREIAPGERVVVAAKQKISFDGADFWLEGVAGLPSRFTRRHVVAAGLLCFSLVLLAAGLTDKPVNLSSIDDGLTSSSNGKTPIAILVNELKEALRMSGLTVDVVWNAEVGQIDVGTPGQPLALSAKTQLTNLLEAFGRRSEAPLRDRTKLSSGVESLIASVALEPTRFIIGTDGRRYREGDAIGGDWTIESISPGTITVARGDQKDDLSLDPLTPSSGLRLAANGEVTTR